MINSMVWEYHVLPLVRASILDTRGGTPGVRARERESSSGREWECPPTLFMLSLLVVIPLSRHSRTSSLTFSRFCPFSSSSSRPETNRLSPRHVSLSHTYTYTHVCLYITHNTFTRLDRAFKHHEDQKSSCPRLPWTLSLVRWKIFI